MGFLKFLKRDKSKDLDPNLGDLDMPPMPPGMEGRGFEGIPELPKLPDFEDTIFRTKGNKPISELKIPPISQSLDSQGATFQPKGFEPIEELKSDFEAQREAELDSTEGELPKTDAETKLKARPGPYEKLERVAVSEERKILEHKGKKGQIFMRVDKFRSVLKNISEIKGSLKASNELLSKLNDIDTETEKEFEKWRNVMTDIQKKLIFVDKVLFKGDKK